MPKGTKVELSVATMTQQRTNDGNQKKIFLWPSNNITANRCDLSLVKTSAFNEYCYAVIPLYVSSST